MNRTILLSLLASTAVGGVATAYLVDPPVNLQAVTPGIQQVGNINVSGKILGGSLSASNSSPTAQVIVGNATSATGANYAGLFRTDSDTGTGIRGVASASSGSANGGTFQSASERGAGVRGFATAVNGVNYGVYGKAVSPDGFAGFFVGRMQTSGDALFSRIGVGNVPFPLENRLKIKDDAENPPTGLGWFLNGVSNSTFFAGRRGVVGQAGGSGAYVAGLTGTANSQAGAEAYGTYGLAAGSGTNYGIYGIAFFGTTNWAGYFSGALYASSSSAGVKAFMIDHPLDPENKVLTHSSVESDQRMNLYRGEIRTDASGFAIVTVPTWFDALNTDIQYQLTVIDESNSSSFVQAKIVQRIRNGKFKIRTSVGGTAVNWLVTGRRHDPTSELYPLEVERPKTEGERGKYYEPEAYGKDKSMGMGYMPMKTEEQAPPKK